MALEEEPAPQWHQHKPGDSDEMQTDASQQTPKPAWYESTKIAAIEKAALPEWFDGSAAHRTPDSYRQAREFILNMGLTMGRNRYVTATMVRRAVPGDAGSLVRLHAFLVAHAVLNADAINDSMPTPAAFLSTTTSAVSKRTILQEHLLEAVVAESRRKKQKTSSDDDDHATIDWEAVANTVGNGATALDCERQFLAIPLDEEEEGREGSITPEPTTATRTNNSLTTTKLQVQQELLRSLVDQTDPVILRAATTAALEASNDDMVQAQRAAATGLVARQALEEARSQQDGVAALLSEIVDLRMQKLENRLSMLDDVEGMLDAERLGLELERRDLYTARCRHWFGGT